MCLDIGYEEESRTVTFRMADKGVPFDPLKKPDPDITLSADDREIGGLGIFIRESSIDLISSNFNEVTLKNVYLLVEGDTSIIQIVTNGVVVGDLVKLALGDFLSFEYCSDGNWYVVEENGALTKFNKVPNIIFNYEFGCGEPLPLSSVELEIYGAWNVTDTILGQFGIDSNSLNTILTVLPDGIKGMLDLALDMTVRDLYNITDGDYSYITDFMATTDIDILTSAIFDILLLSNGAKYEVARDLALELLNGYISSPEINGEVKFKLVVETLFDCFETSDLLEEIEWQVLSLYPRNMKLSELKEETLALDIDEVIDAIEQILLVDATAEDEVSIEKWADNLRNLLDGTLGELIVEENSDQEQILTDLFSDLQVENANEVANYLLSFISTVESVYELIEQNSKPESEFLYELIITAFESDINNTEGVAFILDLSEAIADLSSGSVAEFEAFEQKYGTLTLSVVDGYLGNKLSETASVLGYEIDLSTMTITDCFDMVRELAEDAGIVIEEVVADAAEYFENREFTVEELAKFTGEFIISWLEENGDALEDIVDTSITLEDLDKILLNGELNELLLENNGEILLLLTLDDLISIMNGSATDDALVILDGVYLVDFIQMLQSL